MPTHPSEPEYEQAYQDLVNALEASTLFSKHPSLKTALDIVAVPERVIQFRVIWEDDANRVQVNNGYRVQFNSALGPYKGGTRFHPTVNLSVLKFLALEQTFKNALTGLSHGGAKGGSDFDPKGKSDNKIRRFCTALMRVHSRYIGANTDIPAGDVGVTSREVGWMFGAYKAETALWEGCITGKRRELGGSLMKPEATGYGLVYYVLHMMQYRSDGKDSFQEKRVAISGSGNVAQYAALKTIELGGIVVSLSDSQGAIITDREKGFSRENIVDIKQLRLVRPLEVYRARTRYKFHTQGTDTALGFEDRGNFRYLPSERPWNHVKEVDIVLPSATQNELSGKEAEALISASCRYVAEGSNMGCSQEAISLFEKHRKENTLTQAVWFAPGKGANAGGSAVSGIEMAQNSQRASWTAERNDDELKRIMESCFQIGLNTAKEYVTVAEKALHSLLVAGSNIDGFTKVAAAIQAL